MALTEDHLLRILEEAQRPVGIKELLRLGNIHPGQQTEVKRLLRELLRRGAVRKDGKRFILPGVPTRPERPQRPEPTAAAAAPEEHVRGPRRAQAGPSRGGRIGREAQPPQRRRPEPEGSRGERSVPARRGAAPRPPGRPAAGGGREQRGGWTPPRGPSPSRPGEPMKRMEGTLKVHREGFGFVDSGDKTAENIFVPPHEAARALDNDKVVVEFPDRPGRKEGRIVEVLQRRRQHVVGEYFEQGSRAWVEPREASLGPIRVPRTQLARPGDLVKVRLGVGAELIGRGEGLYGEVAGSVGKPGDPSAEVLSIAYAQGFNDEFPPEVMDQADAISLEIDEEELAAEGRRDLRSLPLVTIDGADARDFDDAVYAERTPGGWRLVVAIADVSHYVVPGTALDDEAYSRATSVYLPDRVLPMLPERLSNGICSLKPDEDRMCMVADMQIDHRGHLGEYELYAAVMRSKARCTYEEVHRVLAGEDVPHRNQLKPQFELLEALSTTLTRMRMARGAIDFDLPETKVVMGEDGLPARMEKRERLESHRLIEECMLAANEAVAKYFKDNDLPSVYRYHGDPDEEKLETFAQLAELHGFYLKDRGNIGSKDLNELIQKLAGHPEARALNQLLLRSMMQAVYSSENVGHYGLAAEHYLHFTSPIRRYPDLIVHRLLKQEWSRKRKRRSEGELETETARLEQMATHCSDRERAAMQAERQVVAFYSVLLMKGRVGEEFEATVAGITDFGFFVELDEEHVEGLVKGESLGPDFELDKTSYTLLYPNGLKIKVGQKLRVVLISANLERRQLEFEAVDLHTADGEPVRLIPEAERGGRRPRGRPDQRGRPEQRGGRRDDFAQRQRERFTTPKPPARPEPQPGRRFAPSPPLRQESSTPSRFSRDRRDQPWRPSAPQPQREEHRRARPPDDDEGPLRLEDVEGGAADRDRPAMDLERLKDLARRKAAPGAGPPAGSDRAQPQSSTWHPLKDERQRYQRPGSKGGKGGKPAGKGGRGNKRRR